MASDVIAETYPVPSKGARDDGVSCNASTGTGYYRRHPDAGDAPPAQLIVAIYLMLCGLLALARPN